MSTKDSEFQLVVPNLNRSEAIRLKNNLITIKQRIAPHATATINFGKKDNFTKVINKCNKSIEGGIV